MDFRHQFDVRRHATAYAYRDIWSDRGQNAVLLLGSDDGIRVWFNHAEVFRKHVHREAHVDQDRVVVPLHRGRNPCMIKVEQGSWGWGAYVEFELAGEQGRSDN